MTNPRSRSKLILALSVLVMQPGFSSAQTSDELSARFDGMWRLASWEHQLEDGTTRQDRRSASYIVYQAGRMCWVAMDPDRPQWESVSSPTPSEALSGIGGLGAYCARVEINEAERSVLHHVDIERAPNNVGITRKRFFEFNGPDELLLTVDPVELSLPLVGMTLVWRRVTSDR